MKLISKSFFFLVHLCSCNNWLFPFATMSQIQSFFCFVKLVLRKVKRFSDCYHLRHILNFLLCKIYMISAVARSEAHLLHLELIVHFRTLVHILLSINPKPKKTFFFHSSSEKMSNFSFYSSSQLNGVFFSRPTKKKSLPCGHGTDTQKQRIVKKGFSAKAIVNVHLEILSSLP